MPQDHASDILKEPTTTQSSQGGFRDLRRLWLLVIISALAPIIMNGVLPANSAITAEFEVSPALEPWTLTIFLIASLIAQPVLGNLADRWGRRPVMIFSLGLFALGCFVSAYSSSITWMFVGRFLQGFGGSVCMFLPRTIVRDQFPVNRAASMIAYMTMAMMIAPMFGPAFGGWVTEEFDWRYLYIILGLIGVSVAIAAWRSLVETHRPALGQKSEPFFRAAFTLLSMPEFRSYAFLIAGSVGVYYSFLGSASYLIMDLRGVSPFSFGRWFMVVAIGYLSGNAFAAIYSERFGVKRMITLGHIPLSIGVVGFWLVYMIDSSEFPVALFFPMMCVAFSNGMSLPSLTSGVMGVYPPLAASASGIAGALQTGVGILLTIALSMMLPKSEVWFQVLITCSALAGMLSWYFGQRAAKAGSVNTA